MQLNTLQQRIRSLYELDSHHDVNDFLVTDRMFADHYGCPHKPLEQLFFRQSGPDTDLSLYLDPRVIQALRRFQPGDTSINMLCLAVEGVSHFVHFCWKMENDRTLSLLELELQAEVDKYVLLTELLGHEGMLERLFENFRLHPYLTEECSERYVQANRLAAKYCSVLEKKYIRQRKSGEMRNELRRFCRRTSGEKIRKIERNIA